MKKTTIIGSGIGGLMTALYLSRDKQRKVTVLEKAREPGGRMVFERHGESRVDQGPTIVLLPGLLVDLMKEGGIEEERIPLIPMDPMYQVTFPDGTKFRKFQDKEKQLKEFSEVFPEEKEGYLNFLKEMEPWFEKGKAQILGQTFQNRKKFLHPSILKLLWGMKAHKSIRSFMSRYFVSEQVLDIYSLQSLYIGGNPSSSPSIYSFISLSEHVEGIWYVKGGYATIIDILTEELKSRGVDIVTDCEVQRILVADEKARGVLTSDGREEAADEIIYNGDFPSMDTLMPGKYHLNKTYTPSSGCVLLYMGIDKIYEDQPVHQFFMTNNFRSHMKEVFEKKTIPADPSIYAFHPSVVDDSLAPPGEGVLYVLIPVPADASIDYGKEESLVKYAIDTLEEEAFPDLRKHMKWFRMRTPKEAEMSGLYKGGSFGIGPTLGQSGVFRPQFRPYPVDGVYAVGASIHPGGGVPIVMQGAKLLAGELMGQVTYN